ncbi:MAG: capsular biosynthesis protein [Candidatus Omnitrophica bacterium]|nr:capsular biosynthesis protein [Candidatus Omnitrophota bacterium]
MVDLHAHILPGIDDGSLSLEESLKMCSMAYQDGIRTIVATPHIGKFPNTKEIITQKTEELKEELKAQKIEIDLLSGADYEFTPEIFTLLESKSLLTINQSRYLLLDTPYSLLPPNIEKLIGGLVLKGIIPIVTHPERCLELQGDLGILYNLIKAGALIQVTASSIIGKMGPKAKESVDLILKHKLAYIIATDTHGINKRPPLLSEALEIASGIIGKEMALAMVTTIPQAIIEDREVVIPKPLPLNKA